MLPRLGDRLSRYRWMAIPIAAYLLITLVLPVAHGAAARAGFARHAAWIALGCATVVAVAVIGGLAVEVARGGVRRLARRGGGS